MDRDEEISRESIGEGHTGYERPQIERVLTPAELEREALYAGDNPISAPPT